uniref:Juvenile hormone acid methyltransferase n=2 Tax=Helicoverpa armigera TaxID=29058 RepID=A0A173GZJ8_HELAM|nr:juvenile hormone acid methyltransferase [Helicoverpa armigera]
MNNAVLYEKSNSLQKRDAIMCLEEYASKIKWKKSNNNILDIGCGDGSVTNMLKKYIPTEYKLLGCDISEKMVNFANDHHCNEQTSFTVLDIEGDLPEGMKGNFDHVFSFYALHWVNNQERAYNNIYNLLSEDGECFTIFVAWAPVFDVYRVLARNNKWSQWVHDVDRYISPYHDSLEPEKDLKTMIDKIGFVDVDVECKELVFVYDNIHILRKALTAINPFKIPKEKYDDFMEDYMDILKELQILDKYNNNYEKSVEFNYRLLVVYARKPDSQDKTLEALNGQT